MIPHIDDKTIADPDPLWRRVPPAMVVFDDNLGRKRPSSSAFSNGRGETPMSVILGRELLQSGRPTQAALAAHADFLIAQVTAGLARECDQTVVRDPQPEEPAHALVCGHKTRGIQSRLAKMSTWVISPGM